MRFLPGVYETNSTGTSAPGTTDVPRRATSGWGGREIGYLFGQYKKLTNEVYRRPHRQAPQLERAAAIRTEATGYGLLLLH